MTETGTLYRTKSHAPKAGNDEMSDVLAFLLRTYVGPQPHYSKRIIVTALEIVPRLVESAIHELRIGGNPICSDSKGYWYGTWAEYWQDCEARERRARNQLTCTAAGKRACREHGVGHIEGEEK